MKHNLLLLALLFTASVQAQVPILGPSRIDSITMANHRFVASFQGSQADSVAKKMYQEKYLHGYTDAMLRKDVATVYAKVLNDYLYAYKVSDAEAERYLRKTEGVPTDDRHRLLLSTIDIWQSRMEKLPQSPIAQEARLVQIELRKLVNRTEATNFARSLASCDKLPKSASCVKASRLYKYTHFEGYSKLLMQGIGILFFDEPVEKFTATK